MKDSTLSDPNVNFFVFATALCFVCIVLLLLLFYVACNRKYRLNWFEKNLLETADTGELKLSEETLTTIQDNAADTKSLFADSSSSGSGECPRCNRQQSQQDDVSWGTANSIPTSPTSFCSCQHAFPSGASVPMARNDNGTQIVLANSSTAKPRIASMHVKLDHTKIDSSLYHKEESEELEEDRGSIHVAITCDPNAGILTVRLMEARGLQAGTGVVNPYAKIRLLPNKTNVWQTRIHKKTLDPVFDEDFVFEIQAQSMARCVLEVIVYTFDAYSRHQSLGAAQFPLASIDFSENSDIWRPLGPLTENDPRVDLGELMVSLAYLPSAERLTVVVIKARNLRVVDDTRNTSDPYVKVCLVQAGKRVKKKKTGVHRNNVSPIINEALTFDVDKETLKKSCLEFYVLHDSLLGPSEILGWCRVGRTEDCHPGERAFYHDMLHSKTATAQWLTLDEFKTTKGKPGM